ADRIDWDTGGFLLLGSIGGAYLGARIFARIPEVWLAGGFVALALASAVRMFLEGDAPGAAATGTASIDASWGGVAGLVVIGFGAGVLGALMGVGGGIVYVPALVTLYGFEQHLAQGTSLAVIVPTAVVAAITHSRRGQVDWRLALLLGGGGLAGGWAGARLALALDAPLLRMLFASFLVLMALRMLWRTWRRRGRPPEPVVAPEPG
ncbi:MAG TPA: sulfite exporter TauE/SafE family protein, partial [Acidimicrobiia bacterium]|nr:sulfite exporter TauE/SafE family protein [Acidimicrobiia bacterium]